MSDTRVLGDLEQAVMEALWSGVDGDVKSVHEAVGAPRGNASNTTQSTLKRLWKKGLLDRQKVSHAYVYSPVCTRADYHRDVLAAVVDQLAGATDRAAVMACFVDVAEQISPDGLDRLEALIAARRTEAEEGPT